MPYRLPGNKRPSNGSLSTTNESSNREELERAYSTGMRIEAAQFELIQCANKKREDYSPASSSSRSHVSRDHPSVTNSDVEHGIRNFTASPPMPTVPEANHYAPRRYVHTLEGMLVKSDGPFKGRVVAQWLPGS